MVRLEEEDSISAAAFPAATSARYSCHDDMVSVVKETDDLRNKYNNEPAVLEFEVDTSTFNNFKIG